MLENKECINCNYYGVAEGFDQLIEECELSDEQETICLKNNLSKFKANEDEEYRVKPL